MNQCHHFEQYLDRRLADNEKLMFETHLGSCLHCQLKLANWEQTTKALVAWLDELGPIPDKRQPLPNASQPMPGEQPSIKTAKSVRAKNMQQAGVIVGRYQYRQRKNRRAVQRAIVAAAAVVLVGFVGAALWAKKQLAKESLTTSTKHSLVSEHRFDLSDKSVSSGFIKQATESLTKENQRSRGDSVGGIVIQFFDEFADDDLKKKAGTKNVSVVRQTVSMNEPVIAAPPEKRVLAYLGNDQVGVNPGGRIEVLAFGPKKTRIRLDKGTIACAVEPRQTKEERFVVELNTATITVIGTQFLVRKTTESDFSVYVKQGTVSILHSDQSSGPGSGKSAKLVSAAQVYTSGGDVLPLTSSEGDGQGDVFQLTRLLNPNPEKVGPLVLKERGEGKKEFKKSGGPAGSRQSVQVNLVQYRQLIVEKQYDKAYGALMKIIKQQPKNVGAWQLLATCQRKMTRYSDAAVSYQKVVALGTAGQANRARLLVGSMYQDKLGQNEKAAAVLKAYLANSPGYTPNRWEVMVRLAKSLFALGRHGEASNLCQAVIAQQQHTSIARQAKQLLEVHKVKE